jgi:hypothetical protein
MTLVVICAVRELSNKKQSPGNPMIIHEVQFHYVKSQCLVSYDCNHDYWVRFFLRSCTYFLRYVLTPFFEYVSDDRT